MASPSKSDVRSPRKQIDYFVPRAGIDREVITTDITHYLGDDALVRPGNYQNPQTGQTQQGYFITAYRNLTTVSDATTFATVGKMLTVMMVENDSRSKSRLGIMGG
ncbi:uncharacterized protein PAC_00193 [Phialocephala subalpina]|uniref:Uncharacterized protein n=1 Tax=Phialocephala subalpina TaxID=576137 RepID=A0A1L7WC30_9HELO|nr:uncharacterized protein PAC_00193 [Phialocephala subalpina]